MISSFARSFFGTGKEELTPVSNLKDEKPMAYYRAKWDTKYKNFFDQEGNELTDEQEKKIKELKKWVFQEKELLQKYLNSLINIHSLKKDNIQMDEFLQANGRLDKLFFFRWLNVFEWNLKEHKIRILEEIRNCIEKRIQREPEKHTLGVKHIRTIMKGLDPHDFIFHFGYNLQGFPILWVKVAKYEQFHRNGKLQFEAFINFMDFIFIDMYKNAPKGRIQNMLIIDIGGVSLKFMKFILQYGKKMPENMSNHVDTLFKAVVVNQSFFVGKAWKIMKGFMIKRTIERFRFLDSVEELKEYIDEKYIPNEYGGSSNFKYCFEEHLNQIQKEKEELGK